MKQTYNDIATIGKDRDDACDLSMIAISYQEFAHESCYLLFMYMMLFAIYT